FNGQSITVPVEDGRFAVPRSVREATFVAFSAVIGQEQIRMESIPGAKFIDRWTLVLEDRRFSEEFRYLGDGAKARSSCVFVYEPRDAEGIVHFSPSCRTALPKR
ncbi:MAG TPA: hypothetical protein VGA40_03550, partial [Candidatus Acidoferrales bacterium]